MFETGFLTLTLSEVSSPRRFVFINSMAASLYIVQNQGDGIYQGIKGIVNDLKIDTKKDFFS